MSGILNKAWKWEAEGYILYHGTQAYGCQLQNGFENKEES